MQTLPRDVHIGMRVIDSAQNEIGKVEDFRFSENEEEPDVEPATLDTTARPADGNLMSDLAQAFAPDEMPDEMRERLLREGYILLDTKGLFAVDRYVLPEQIASSTGDTLTLSVTRNELMKH
ncbi:MAG TPA: hypothetical protein VHB74_10090 [Devosia sp.]|nr:hypothetical protein [Devosia sp.]